jgi:hypothetical protein
MNHSVKGITASAGQSHVVARHLFSVHAPSEENLSVSSLFWKDEAEVAGCPAWWWYRGARPSKRFGWAVLRGNC